MKMNMSKIFTKDTFIKVSVVKLDGRKLTKSIFNQLHTISPFDRLYNLKNDVKVLGYINDKTIWIIWSNQENLYKYDLQNIYPLVQLDLNKNTIENLIEIYPSEQVKNLYYGNSNENYQELEISSVLDKKEQYKILDRQDFVIEFKAQLLERQIFL